MIYPDKVRFGGIEFQVVLDREPIPHPWEDGKRLNGVCLFDDKIMFLYDNKACPSSTEETFIHELLEGIKDTYDIKMDHQTLKTIGVALHQALASAQMDFGQSVLNKTIQ